MASNRINSIRDLNKKRILEYIVANQPTSRVAISSSIGLTKATVSAIVAELIADNILVESQTFESTGGRKPTSIILNKDSFHVVSIDYSRGHISGALINLNGEIIHQDLVKTTNETNFKNTLEETFTLIDSLVSKLSNKSTFKAISISVDGSVTKSSHIKLAHTKKWENININDYMVEKYGVQSYTNNEANLAALGENSFFRHIPNLTMISMHTGVGMGTIQEYSLLTGYDGLAGEIGHTIVNINGIPCSCGNNGCIEQYVSVENLKKRVSETLERKDISIRDIVHLYDSGNPEVITILNDYCKYLGVLITNTINLVNPNELIIANELLDFIPSLLQTTLKYVNLTVSSTNSIRLSSSNDIELLGAAVIAIREYLQIKHFYPNIK